MKKRYFGVLLGLIAFSSTTPLASVHAEAKYLPGGENVAIEIKADGLLVTGTYDIKTENGTYNPAKDNDIVRGDLIYEVNQHKIESLKDLPKVFENVDTLQYDVPIKLYREHLSYDKVMRLIKTNSEGTWKTGLLVKERILGIGTVTIYNTQTKSYAALGHQFSDGDFSDILDLTSGNIYSSEVVGIRKSNDGTPGEKVAQINENEKLGTIIKNNNYGVYGKIDKLPSKKGMSIAKQDEIKTGEAEIWTVMKNHTIGKYKIKITNLKKQDQIAPKGITFEIIDKDLLNISNGIVQGMSGSPIIQNNKIIGAVTHVLVDDVQKGYGLYIEWMLQEMN